MKKKVGIVGAGLQGRRRAPAILEDPDWEIEQVIDLEESRARNLAAPIGAKVGTDWRAVTSNRDVEVVLVLTYPDSHATISLAAMEAGKDVLCEKPLARTIDEARALVETAQRTRRILKCGFNHRHHPAVLEAHRLFCSGLIGKAVFGRSRYGIGGRQGIECEWRSDPKIVGGGQLMEQGIHIVDLFRWFLGEMRRVTGFVSTTRWPIAPIEDNGFALLETRDGVTASIHSSLTQWTNLFEFEVYGEKGSLTVQGLGASYGVEQLVVSQHDPTAPFSHQTIEFRGGDASWKAEWQEFTRAVRERAEPMGGALDGLRAMQIVDAVYAASKTGQAVALT